MSRYKHIFFDLDHTLWDYDANAAESLQELFDHYQLDALGLFSPDQLVSTFLQVNDELWNLYNQSKIQRADIRARRFPSIFERLGAQAAHVPSDIEPRYIALTPTKEKTFENAHHILDYLANHYELHVITNGFNDIQSTKLKSSGLENYFDVIVTSETTGFRKPDKEIFELAMNTAKAHVSESIMIGDNLDSDIAGAQGVGMDHVWFNPTQKISHFTVQHEIQNLIELKSIL